MTTKKDLLREATNAGLCCFWKLNKPELETLLNTLANKQTVDDRFLGKKKIGETCTSHNVCRTRRCESNRCVSSKYKVKVEVIKEPSPSAPLDPLDTLPNPIKPNKKPAKLPKPAKVDKPKTDKPMKEYKPKPNKHNQHPKPPSANANRSNNTCGSMLCTYF